MRNNSEYKSYSLDELEELFSRFVVSNWSYSMVSAFARNEKAFEMNYIYKMYGKKSATTNAGNAYHAALEYYFNQKKESIENEVPLVDLEAIAFSYIEGIPANQWKIQETTPTIEKCLEKAHKIVSALLRNFISEIDVYMEEVAEVLDVEIKDSVFLVVNGIDIPLPCHFKTDVAFRLKDGKIVIIDHKSKNSFTSDEEIALLIGTQAITYVLAYEELKDIHVDGVWYIENKYSQNKDKTAQLSAFKIMMDDNTRKLYEFLLYEPLKRMIEAVSNPDYVYLINQSDNYTDRAELYDFWARTCMAEIDVFVNIDESKKPLIAKRLRKIKDSSVQMIPPSVIKNFKENASKFIQYDLSNTNMTPQEKIEHVLKTFGVLVNVAHKFEGFSSNTFLLEVGAGVKVASIYPKRLDIANALDVSNVRISNDLVVYNGKAYVSIDFSKKRDRDLIFDPSLLTDRKIPLGKDNFDDLIYWDWDNHSTPHALVCGATGSGKSVLVRSVIEYAQLAHADEIVIFDPKYEFLSYKNIGAKVINEIDAIEEEMEWLVAYMEDLVKNNKKKTTFIVFDEFADAMANSKKGNELNLYESVMDGNYANGSTKMKRVCTGQRRSLEENLRILLQKGRSSGFRILAATQRASVKVITGDAKVNFPIQICFKVPKELDSRVVLDEAGAESLSGMGDGLIKSPEYNEVIRRFQAFYIPDGNKKVNRNQLAEINED